MLSPHLPTFAPSLPNYNSLCGGLGGLGPPYPLHIDTINSISDTLSRINATYNKEDKNYKLLHKHKYLKLK